MPHSALCSAHSSPSQTQSDTPGALVAALWPSSRCTACWSLEQYCEMTERAAPLPGDERDPLIVAVRPLLARTQLQERPLKCVYDADVDGWSPAAFHAKVLQTARVCLYVHVLKRTAGFHRGGRNAS
jgi:hypothetical protein